MAVKTKKETNEIKLTRTYDAPVKLVWDAWTDPKKAAIWWGPRGFTITTHSKDFRPGGIWHYTMHGPDGVDYPNKTKYLEIDNLKRMVYDHGGNDERAPMFRVTVLFTDLKGKTRMDMTMAFDTVEAARISKKFIAKASGNSTWDRLGEYLEKETKNQEKFFISRTFDAPLALMYKLFTDPNHLAKWVAPQGFETKYLKSDIRPGGSVFYMMFNDAGHKMYGITKYIELNGKDKIVYTQQFADENGNVSRHPAAPTWPETMMTTITLRAESDAETTVTIEWQPHGQVSTEELQTFVTARAGMTGGWTGSFDKLDEYIATFA